MSTTSDAARDEPACVHKLLSRLDQVAQRTEDALPLGPYLADALIEDVAHCPALGPDGGRPTVSDDALANALHKAQRAAALVRACPSMERDWAVARLRSAVEQARGFLKARTAALLANRPDADIQGAVEAAVKSDRCATCPFA